MTDALDIATRLLFLGAAAMLFVAAAFLAGVAWITLTRQLDARRWAIRDRDDAARERELLDQLAPPDGTLPPESLAAGRDRLHAAVTADHLRDLVGPIDWPKEDQ